MTIEVAIACTVCGLRTAPITAALATADVVCDLSEPVIDLMYDPVAI